MPSRQRKIPERSASACSRGVGARVSTCSRVSRSKSCRGPLMRIPAGISAVVRPRRASKPRTAAALAPSRNARLKLCFSCCFSFRRLYCRLASPPLLERRSCKTRWHCRNQEPCRVLDPSRRTLSAFDCQKMQYLFGARVSSFVKDALDDSVQNWLIVVRAKTRQDSRNRQSVDESRRRRHRCF